MEVKQFVETEPATFPNERGFVSIGNTAGGRDIAAPFMIKQGKLPGPRLWLNAAVHGDEINGIFAAVNFFRQINPAEMNGSVVVTPISNILALDERRKSSVIDGIDMDQSFPGRSEGFATERLASRLFNRFGSDADVVVNLHTLSTPFDAKPYAVYKVHPNGLVPEQTLLDHIACFEPTVACRMPVTNAVGELPGNITGALDYQCLARGAIAFMIELGGGGRLEPDVITQGAAGLERLARRLGILDREHVESKAIKLNRVTSRAHKLACAGGFFHAETSAGEVVAAGERLGTIRNMFGDIVEEIKVDSDTWVIAIRRDPVVHSGDRIAFLALDWGEVDANC